DERVFLQVEDQGIGFDPKSLNKSGDHMGLSGMQERVEVMGGILTVDSRPGQGTRVMVEMTSIGEEEHDG
ncbi:MAG TPA: histidine kinase, partial [Chloroflexi bacterium]|nr:histidine kinase [Chloroflexota bacterium]